MRLRFPQIASRLNEHPDFLFVGRAAKRIGTLPRLAQPRSLRNKVESGVIATLAAITTSDRVP
jgi:hypothetical protein